MAKLRATSTKSWHKSAHRPARSSSPTSRRTRCPLRGRSAHRPPLRAEAEDLPVEILYSSDGVIAVNKPAGMVVHPGAGVTSGTLANAIAWHFKAVPPVVTGGFAAMRVTGNDKRK